MAPGLSTSLGTRCRRSGLSQRVWCFGAQSYRPFGTAAEFTAVPARQAIPLPDNIGFEAGACLGIPALTAHRAVHAGGSVAGQHVLVQGGAGAVGCFGVGFARHAGAQVIATVRSAADEEPARRSGAHHVVHTDGRSQTQIVADLLRAAPDGVQHIVEVAFDVNIDIDVQVLALGGSIAAYATDDPRPAVPFWELLFKNARLLTLGSDDFPTEEKIAGAVSANEMLAAGWAGFRSTGRSRSRKSRQRTSLSELSVDPVEWCSLSEGHLLR